MNPDRRMCPSPRNLLLTAFATFAGCFLGGCVEEGHASDCGMGGSGSLAEEGCATPVGGSCLTEKDFKAARPPQREDGKHTVTIADDWISYQEVRPLCEFECLTEAEFRAGRSTKRQNKDERWILLDDDWDDYINERRPDCAP